MTKAVKEKRSRRRAGNVNWLVVIYGLLGVVSIAMIVVGAVVSQIALTAGGIVGLMVITPAAVLSWQIRRLQSQLGAGAGGPGDMLSRIHEHVMLSDTAKRALFRRREIELLRRAVNEEIERGDYDGAMTLCDDMAELFGQREDAEEFRMRILTARRERDEARISQLLNQLDMVLEIRDWGQAHQLAARIRRLYSESHLIHGIDQRILRAREEYQQELVGRMLEHADEGDFEHAMATLKELDGAMGRHEAESLGHLADRVVTGWREQLAERFKAAVAEHRWGDAVTAGEQLIDEFPRTRAADEVRTVLETIRARSQGNPVV